jgi:hypothetical protein
MHTKMLKTDAAWLQELGEHLAPLLRALKVGVDRIEGEVDYSDPKNLVVLLENRGCTVIDASAVERLVREDPAVVQRPDIDLCDAGGSWEQAGGPWADRLEAELIGLGAARREPEPGDPADRDLARRVKAALEGASDDAEHDALAAVAEHFGVTWQHRDA